MKKIEITLIEYCNFVGRIDKLNLSEVRIDKGGKDDNKKIIRIDSIGNNNLFTIFFEDGSSNIYSSMWVKCKVNFQLSEQYFK